MAFETTNLSWEPSERSVWSSGWTIRFCLQPLICYIKESGGGWSTQKIPRSEMQQLRRGCGLQTERIHSFGTSSQLSVGQPAILNSQVRLKISLPWGWGETNGYSLIFNKQPPFLGGRLRYMQYNLTLLSQVRVARSYTGSRRKIEKEGNFSIISRGNSCCYWPEESFADTHNFLGIPHQLDLAERSVHLWHGVALPPHRHLHCILQGRWQQPAKIDRIWVFSEHPDGPPAFIPISILPILFFFLFF